MPGNYTQTQADLLLMVYCMQRRKFASADHMWAHVFFRMQDILVMHPLEIGGECFFSLGDFGGVAALLWPSKKTCLPRGTIFAMRDDVAVSDVQVVFVLNQTGWLVMPFEWRGPLEASLVLGSPIGVWSQWPWVRLSLF